MKPATSPPSPPHNFNLFEPDQDYYLPWSYTSEKGTAAINVDMYGAIQQIELLSGKHFIYGKDLGSGETFTPTNLAEILSVPEAFQELDVQLASLVDQVTSHQTRVTSLDERLTALEATSTSSSPSPNPGEGNDDTSGTSGDSLLVTGDSTLTDLDLNSLIIRADATIYGTLVTDTLEVATALNLHGDATIWGKLLVKDDVEFEKNARVAGALTRGNEQTGVIEIPAHAREVRVTFPEAFAAGLGNPIITVSPENTFTKVAVFAVSKTSFELHVADNNPANITVRWTAVALPDSARPVDIEVLDEFSAPDAAEPLPPDQTVLESPSPAAAPVEILPAATPSAPAVPSGPEGALTLGL